MVYWGESHDTYANDGGESKNKSQNVIDRAYAVVAGNNGATALYFSRPAQKAKNDIKFGDKGSVHFKDAEVAQVNHMHNVCAGEPNYYVKGNGVCAQVRKSGAIIVLGSGSDRDVTVANGAGDGKWLKPGTYKDMVMALSPYIASLKDGHKMYSSYDVGKQLDRKRGYLALDNFDYGSLFNTSFPMNKADRIATFDSGSTHAMTLTAVDLDANGKPVKWKVENSWGADNGFAGCFIMTNDWFNEYMFRLVVDKKYASEQLLKEFDQKPTMLTPDDPLFQLED